MKSAWKNLITGLVDGNADIGKLVDNLVTTIVGDGTANNLGVLGNIMPAVKSALNGAARLVSNLLPRIIQEIPDIIHQNLPVLIKSAFDIIENVFKGLKKNKTKLIKSIGKAVSYIFDTITNPDTIQGLFDVALELVETLADMLLRDDVLDKMIDSAVKIVVTLGDFIVNNVDRLFEVATKIVTSLLGYLLDPENIGKILEAGAKIIQTLGESFVKAVEGLGGFITDIAAWLVKKFTGIDLTEAGKEVMKTFFMGLLGVAKAQRVPIGITFSGISPDGSHRSGLDYVPYDGYIAELHKGERVLTASEARGYGTGTSIGNITINIDGAKYDDEQSLAEAVAEAIQEMTDRRSAVYA
jgi:phage-related protein